MIKKTGIASFFPINSDAEYVEIIEQIQVKLADIAAHHIQREEYESALEFTKLLADLDVIMAKFSS